MVARIARTGATIETIDVTTTPSKAQAFQLGERAGALLHVTAASGPNLVLKFNSYIDGNPYTAKDAANADKSVTFSVGGWYQLPDELFAASRVGLFLASGTATVVVTQKS